MGLQGLARKRSFTAVIIFYLTCYDVRTTIVDTTTPMSTRPHRPTPSRSCAGTMLHKAGATVAHLHARRVATPDASAARLVRVLVLLHRRHGSALGHAMRRGQHVGLAFRSWVVPSRKESRVPQLVPQHSNSRADLLLPLPSFGTNYPTNKKLALHSPKLAPLIHTHP